MIIDIDFVAGSHGNYLEFVLTKLVFPNDLPDSPFNEFGASHNKHYIRKLFYCDHYFQKNGIKNKNVISIQFTHDDLLQLMSISLLRAGDTNINDKDLHIDTFQKLNNKFYKSILDNILKSYNQIFGYDAIKAAEWPCITTVDEFYKLPNWIIQECANDFNFIPKQINQENPNISRSILREFFKHGFMTPSINGFMKEQEKMIYDKTQKVFIFPFSSFYNFEEFNKNINGIKEFFNLSFTNYDIHRLHNEFLKNQPYKNLKKDTDDIIEKILANSNMQLDLTLFQESYVNAKLELQFRKEMPFDQDQYFNTTEEIYNYLNEIPQ